MGEGNYLVLMNQVSIRTRVPNKHVPNVQNAFLQIMCVIL
jgi:hypothetical protein